MGQCLIISICETEKLTMRKFTALVIALLLTSSFAAQAGSEVRPADGTLRYLDALAFPGLVVEYEIWAAR